jgi:hypothetical protein
MTHPADPSIPSPDPDTARTHRQLRLMKALLVLDDPEVERALTLIVERLVAAEKGGDVLPPPRTPPLKPVG